ncbi:MAG: hypothetical protein WCO93_03820 [bacterium]
MYSFIRFKTRYIESKVFFLGAGNRTFFYMIHSVALVPKPEPDHHLKSSRTIPEIFWQ